MNGLYEDDIMHKRIDGEHNAKLMTLLPLLQEQNGGVLECCDRIASTSPMLRSESSTLQF